MSLISKLFGEVKILPLRFKVFVEGTDSPEAMEKLADILKSKEKYNSAFSLYETLWENNYKPDKMLEYMVRCS